QVDAERLALRDLAVAPDEAGLLDDPHVVFLARNRARERRHRGLAHAVDRKPRALAVDGQVDRRPVDGGCLVERRVEDLEEPVALLPTPDPRQGLELLVVLTVDVRVTLAAFVVDRAGPPQCPGDLRAAEIRAVEAPALDHVRQEGLAITLGRGWKAAEVAAAAGVAVTELDVRAGDPPLGHRCRLCRAQAPNRALCAQTQEAGERPAGVTSTLPVSMGKPESPRPFSVASRFQGAPMRIQRRLPATGSEAPLWSMPS